MTRLPEPGAYNRNGVPFSVFLQDKHSAVRESSNKLPYFQGDQATSAQKRKGADFTRVRNHSIPQTASKERALSSGLNNGIHSTEARRNSGTLNSSIEVAKTDGIHANITGSTDTSDWQWNWKKISRSARKRYHKLKEEGIPQEEARKLCRLPWSDLENMLSLNKAQKRDSSEPPQGPANKIMKMPTGVDEQNSRSSNDIRPLCVGITNSIPMSEDQMRTLHRHLIIAITEKCFDGEGPEFLGFSHKTGWVLVTCVNQHSKDWLVHEVPYLEPWPGAQLSIIPVEELPKPPSAITFIPESEAASVEEALNLLRVQNKDLNTELWKVRFEKVEKEGRVVSFTIDHPSADALRAQDCQAAIGFKMVTFKIKGQYRPYNPLSATQNQVSATQNQSATPGSSIPQGSHRLVDKPSDQAWKTTVTNKNGTSSATRGCQPQTANQSKTQTIQHRDFQASAEKTQCAQGIGGITSWKEPSPVAAVGQSMPQNKGEFGAQPITQGHGRKLFPQKHQGQVIIKEPSISTRGFAPQVGKGRVTAQPFIQDSQIGRTLFTKGSGTTVGEVFDVDGSVLATRERSSQIGDSSSHGGASFDRDRVAADAIDLDKYSSQGATGGTRQDRNNPSSFGGTAYGLNKGVGIARELNDGFGARPIFQNSLGGRNPFGQGKSGKASLTKSGQDGFSTLAKGNLLQAGNPPNVERTFVQNGVETTVRSDDRDGFSGPSQASSWFGGHPFTRDSQFGRTMFNQDGSGDTDRTISDQNLGLTTNQVPRSQFGSHSVQDTQSHEAFDQCRNEVDLTVTDSDERSPRGLSPEAEGGYNTWVIEDLESYSLRLTQNEPGITDTVTAATGPPLGSGYTDQSYTTQFSQGSRTSANREMMPDRGQSPQERDGHGDRIIGSESRGRPFHGSRSGRDSRPDKGLLPHPSGSFDSRTIEPESHGTPFQGRRETLTDRESRSHRGLLSHPSGGSEIRPESHGRSFQGSRGIPTDRESRSHGGLLPHPSGGSEIEPESHRRPFQGSKGTGTDRGSRSDRLSPQARDSYGDGTQGPEPLGRPFQGSKATLTDRESSSDRLSPHARGGYGAWTNKDPESYRRGTSFGSSMARAQTRDEFDKRATVSGVSRLKRPHMAGGHSLTVQRPEKRPR